MDEGLARHTLCGLQEQMARILQTKQSLCEKLECRRLRRSKHSVHLTSKSGRQNSGLTSPQPVSQATVAETQTMAAEQQAEHSGHRVVMDRELAEPAALKTDSLMLHSGKSEVPCSEASHQSLDSEQVATSREFSHQDWRIDPHWEMPGVITLDNALRHCRSRCAVLLQTARFMEDIEQGFAGTDQAEERSVSISNVDTGKEAMLEATVAELRDHVSLITAQLKSAQADVIAERRLKEQLKVQLESKEAALAHSVELQQYVKQLEDKLAKQNKVLHDAEATAEKERQLRVSVEVAMAQKEEQLAQHSAEHVERQEKTVEVAEVGMQTELCNERLNLGVIQLEAGLDANSAEVVHAQDILQTVQELEDRLIRQDLALQEASENSEKELQLRKRMEAAMVEREGVLVAKLEADNRSLQERMAKLEAAQTDIHKQELTPSTPQQTVPGINVNLDEPLSSPELEASPRVTDDMSTTLPVQPFCVSGTLSLEVSACASPKHTPGRPPQASGLVHIQNQACLL